MKDKLRKFICNVMKFINIKKSRIKKILLLLVLAVLILNPFGSSYITSVASQEFFLYHIKDLVEYVTGGGQLSEDFHLSTGTYEKQKDGELFGVAEGRNLIVIQMESFQNMMIGADYYGQEITPFLNEFIEGESTVYFDNFYSQIGGGNTSDAELAANNSLFGAIESYSYQMFEDNYFKGLPWLLQERGYSTSVMHGFEKDFWNRENIYPTLGIQKFYGDTEFESDNIKGIGGGNIVGISDSAFFKQSVEHMKELPQPFYNMLITLSTHNPFNLPDELSELKLRERDKNLVGNYYDSIHYADKCIGEFIQGLKDEGLYENSVIVMYGDHFGLSRADPNVANLVSQWLGREYTYDMMANVPLIIHIPGQDVKETLSISGGQVDILPTVAYLMGFESLDTLYMGQNLFTAKEGFVPQQIHMIKGSFIKDDIVFEMSRDGVFHNSKAWNRKSGEAVDINGLEEEYLRAKEKIELSHFYLYNDILRLAIEEGKSEEQIMAKLDDNEKLPKEMKFTYISAEKPEEIEKMVEYLEENPEKYVLLSSGDLINILNAFEEEYSGITNREKVGGIKKIDKEANENFEAMKARIVPLMQNTENYSKIEYMGYDNIFILPDYENYTLSEMKEFVSANRPSGIVIDISKGIKWQKELANYMEITQVYAYSLKGIDLADTLKLKINGVYGTIK